MAPGRQGRRRAECLQRRDMPAPQRDVALLLHPQAFVVPLTFQHVLAREHRAQLRVLHAHALVHAVRHDVQQRLQRRAGRLHAAVFEVIQGHAALRFDDRVHAGGERCRVLLLRAQHLFGEHAVRRLEQAAQELVREQRRDAVAQPARQHLAAACFEIIHLLQVAAADQKRRVALLRLHPAPQLRHQHADVVIDAELRADVARGGGETGIAREDERNQRVVQIDHRPQGVEWAFGHRAFAAEARRGGRFAGQAAREIHEQLGQFLVVDRAVNRQRRQADLRVRRTAAASGEYRVHREMDAPFRRDFAVQPRADFGQVRPARVDHVRALLQIARVLRRASIDHARMRRRDGVGDAAARDEASEQPLHRLGVFVELDHVVDDRPRLFHRQRLEVRDERAGRRQVGLGLRVEAAMDRLIRTLEQQRLAVGHQFDARIRVARIEVVQALTRHHH